MARGSLGKKCLEGAPPEEDRKIRWMIEVLSITHTKELRVLGLKGLGFNLAHDKESRPSFS